MIKNMSRIAPATEFLSAVCMKCCSRDEIDWQVAQVGCMSIKLAPLVLSPILAATWPIHSCKKGRKKRECPREVADLLDAC